MKATLGILIMVVGVAFGVYAGVWWAFIGGMVDVISAIRAPELISMNIAIGVVKVMFAGFIGGVCGILIVSPGYALLKSAGHCKKH